MRLFDLSCDHTQWKNYKRTGLFHFTSQCIETHQWHSYTAVIVFLAAIAMMSLCVIAAYD